MLSAYKIEFCISPTPRPLNFCLLVFKVTVHLAVCRQTQKPKDTVTLGVTTPEELCLSASLYPSEQGSWRDQVRGAKLCLGLLTATAAWSRGLVRERNLLPNHLYFPSLSWGAEWEFLSLLITNKPKGSLNKHHTQIWCNLFVIASAWVCTKTGSHVSPWDLCLRIRTEVLHISFGRNNACQSIQKCVSLPEVRQHQVEPKIPCCYGCHLL